jgi:gas vesicle protein
MTTETQTETVSDMAKRFILAEQFATEWLMVAENIEETQAELMQDAQEAEGVADLSNKLSDEWETLAEQVMDLVTDKISETAGLFIGQMLKGQGSLPFDIIARQTLDNLKR